MAARARARHQWAVVCPCHAAVGRPSPHAPSAGDSGRAAPIPAPPKAATWADLVPEATSSRIRF